MGYGYLISVPQSHQKQDQIEKNITCVYPATLSTLVFYGYPEIYMAILDQVLLKSIVFPQ